MQRRQFIKNALCAAAGSALFTGFAGKLSLAQAAVGTRRLLGADYRALVCVYLYGGNDSFNMLVPRSGSQYTGYAASRAALAIPAANLLPLTPVAAPSDGGSYGFHPSMPQLAALFNQTNSPLAVAANVGPLLYPIDKTQYQNKSVPVPAQLFSHADQSSIWQQATADLTVPRGWGGLLADMFHASNTNQQLSMNVSVDGQNVFQTGNQIIPYFVSQAGAQDIAFIDTSDGQTWNADRRAAFIALRDGPHANALQGEYARIMHRSMDNGALINSALSGETALATAFPANNDLADQLRMVARLINVRAALGMQRQIFFVGLGGFDTHDTQLDDQAARLGELDGALAAFHAATVEMGLADAVTTFTASDFGRTTSINGDGTDHGWGSHHLVMGGAVNGGRMHGTMPNLAPDSADDADWGQIIPTASVDQYAATLATWYGVPSGELTTIFPNVNRFATADLGFMS
jgi:uncharacterized protein (DUF1501 family)